MKTAQDIIVGIPADIAALPLTIAEKVTLTHIAQDSACSNATIARLLGVTVRGTENLLKRLREGEYVRSVGKGRARRHHLTFPVEHHMDCGHQEIVASVSQPSNLCADEHHDAEAVEPHVTSTADDDKMSLADDSDQTLRHHTKCGKYDAVKSHTSCGKSVNLEPPLAQFILSNMQIANRLASDPNRCDLAKLEQIYRQTLQRVQADMPDCSRKICMMNELARCLNATFAMRYVRQNIAMRFRDSVSQTVVAAKPERLAQFREQVEAEQLSIKSPDMLAAWFSSDIHEGPC